MDRIFLKSLTSIILNLLNFPANCVIMLFEIKNENQNKKFEFLFHFNYLLRNIIIFFPIFFQFLIKIIFLYKIKNDYEDEDERNWKIKKKCLDPNLHVFATTKKAVKRGPSFKINKNKNKKLQNFYYQIIKYGSRIGEYLVQPKISNIYLQGHFFSYLFYRCFWQNQIWPEFQFSFYFIIFKKSTIRLY